jgi:hypothetical protein
MNWKWKPQHISDVSLEAELAGRKVRSVRMTDDAGMPYQFKPQYGWDGPHRVVIEFEDGLELVVASYDPEFLGIETRRRG